MRDPLPHGAVIRKLWIGETGVYRDHLLRLDPDSRRNRFAGAVSDEFVRDYAELSFGIDALKPQDLFGSDLPPLLHGTLWSLSLNILTYIVLSLMRAPSSIERLQADTFVPNTLTPITPSFRRWRTTVTVQDIQNTVTQYIGEARARENFDAFATRRRVDLDPNAPADFELLKHAEYLSCFCGGVHL